MDDPARCRLMHLTACAALLGLCLGCESMREHLGVTKKFKNPVCPPPPTRIANMLDDPNPELAETAPGDGGVAWISATSEEKGAPPLPNGDVAATVNGVPIFIDEVLQPFASGLAKEAEQRPAEEMQKIREGLVMRHLRPHLEREVLIQALKLKLKEEQIKGFEGHLDKEWLDEEKEMMKKFRVSTRAELDAELKRSGSSVQVAKTTFKNQKMAQQYLSMKSMSKEKIGRPELLAYYHAHLEDYDFIGQVKWQQIELKPTEHGGREKTRRLAEKLVTDLEQGASFDLLAQKYSSGPTAKQGGVWDWTKQGSISWDNVEQALFEIPVGSISEPLETTQGLQIVKVLDRKDAGRKPFDEVQQSIQNTLIKERFREKAGELINELLDSAEIRTMFERPEASDVVPADRETQSVRGPSTRVR